MHKPTHSQVLTQPGRETDIRSALRVRLLSLPFPAFARVVARLLERLGYQNVRLVGRAISDKIDGKRGIRGVHTDGIGWDLEASVPATGFEGNRGRVLVALKQYRPNRLIRRRMADELRGACLRAGASAALLVTTSDLPQAFETEPPATGFFAPVRVLGGSELLDLMVAHRVGLWEEAGSSINVPSRYGIDEGFFADLNGSRGHMRRAKAMPGKPSKSRAVPSRSVTVTVRIEAAGTRCGSPETETR